jgi:hypothetical protein
MEMFAGYYCPENSIFFSSSWLASMWLADGCLQKIHICSCSDILSQNEAICKYNEGKVMEMFAGSYCL